MFEDIYSMLNGGQPENDVATDLAKTMQFGHANGTVAPASYQGGAVFQMESVDATLKSVTYDQSHFVLWPTIAQARAFSLVEQYNRVTGYGDNGSAYIPESGSPRMNDSEYNRQGAKVVFLATRRGVPMVSQFLRMHAPTDIEGAETQSGTLWLLEKLERELYFGSGQFSNAGAFDGSIAAIPVKIQNLNLSGLDAEIRRGDTDEMALARSFEGYSADQSVIQDLAGEILDEDALEALAQKIMQNLGRPKTLDCDTKTMSDFIRTFLPKERVNPMGILDGRAGYVVRTYASLAGDIALRPNVFLFPKKKKFARAAPGTLGAPASASASQAAGSSDLKNGDILVYEVASCNEQGEGSATVVASSLTVSADGNRVTLTIGDPSSGTPTHYAVYRTDKTGAAATREFIGYVRRSGTSTSFIDDGKKLPGGAQAFMLDMRPDILQVRQLAPLLKLPQGQIGTAREYILWLAVTLIVAHPRAQGVCDRIGRAVTPA